MITEKMTNENIESLQRSYLKPDAQRTELPKQSPSRLKNFFEKTRGVVDWVKKDAQESLEMMKNMFTNPKQAFVDLGKDINILYDAVKINLLRLTEAKNLLEVEKRITPEAKILKQEYPNPLAVFPNGNVQNIGKQTMMMGVEGVKKGRIEKRDDGEFYLEGRRIIGKSNRIDGGVYPGSSFDSEGKYGREIIVADFERDAAVRDFYDNLVARIQKSNNKSIENVIKIYDELLTPKINLQKSEELANLYKDQKVQLGLFLVQGGVVCRHNAVLFALMLEKMKEGGVIEYNYKCTIERHNGNWKGSEGNHAYCKVKVGNQFFVADRVQRESGELEKVGKMNEYAAKGDLSNDFTLGQDVKVLRNDSNRVEIWQVKSIIRDPENHRKDLIFVTTTINGQEFQKHVSFETLLHWQNIKGRSFAKTS